jgi:hypothetical protein
VASDPHLAGCRQPSSMPIDSLLRLDSLAVFGAGAGEGRCAAPSTAPPTPAFLLPEISTHSSLFPDGRWRERVHCIAAAVGDGGSGGGPPSPCWSSSVLSSSSSLRGGRQALREEEHHCARLILDSSSVRLSPDESPQCCGESPSISSSGREGRGQRGGRRRRMAASRSGWGFLVTVEDKTSRSHRPSTNRRVGWILAAPSSILVLW